MLETRPTQKPPPTDHHKKETPTQPKMCCWGREKLGKILLGIIIIQEWLFGNSGNKAGAAAMSNAIDSTFGVATTIRRLENENMCHHSQHGVLSRGNK